MRGFTSGSSEAPLAAEEEWVAPGLAAVSAMARVWRYPVKARPTQVAPGRPRPTAPRVPRAAATARAGRVGGLPPDSPAAAPPLRSAASRPGTSCPPRAPAPAPAAATAAPDKRPG